MSLQETQEKFQNLIGTVDENDKKEFLAWIRRSYLVRTCSGQQPAIAHSQLKRTANDVKSENLPLSGVLPSESIKIPEKYEDPDILVFVDQFLNESYDIQELQKKGELAKFFCKDCKSKNTAPLKILSESTSKEKIDLLFSYLLPSLDGKTIVNVRSRLGGWIYAAYLYTQAAKIISIEENESLCALQKKVIEKHNMQDRIQVINGNILDASETFQTTDVLILADILKVFPSESDQRSLWKLLKDTLKSGAMLVTLNKLEDLKSAKEVIGDLSAWVELETDSESSGLLHSKDSREPNVLFVYKIL